MSKHASGTKKFSTVREVRAFLFEERNQDGKHVRVYVGSTPYKGTVREVRQTLTFDRRDQDLAQHITLHFVPGVRKAWP
jgi:hypothetical protein